jgi:hypothetical protein
MIDERIQRFPIIPICDCYLKVAKSASKLKYAWMRKWPQRLSDGQRKNGQSRGGVGSRGIREFSSGY